MAVGDNFRSADILQGQPLGMVSKTVLLSADDTVVDVSGVSLLDLKSDNATSTSRTFTVLASPKVGHELLVIFTSASSLACELATSSTMRLVGGKWVPAQYDTLRLVSDGTAWNEVARSGTLTSTVTLTADDTAVATAGVQTILLGSDNATAANRTFTLTASAVVGHALKIVFTTAGGTTAQLADTGIQKLSAAWEPLQYDTLSLVSDGTNWVELCRADN